MSVRSPDDDARRAGDAPATGWVTPLLPRAEPEHGARPSDRYSAMFEPLPEPDEPSFEEPPRLLREPAGDATDSGPHPAVVPEPVDIVPSELRRPGIVFRTRAALGLLLVVALAGVGLATAIGLGIAVLALVLRRAVGS